MKRFIIASLILIMVIGIFLNIPKAQAQKYELLQGLPISGLGQGQTVTLAAYVNGMIRIGIILAGVLAVVMIIIGGFMYITAGGNPGTVTKAKTYIWDAIIGLLIAVSFFIVLSAINPDILNISNIVTPYDLVIPTGQAGGGGGGAGGGGGGGAGGGGGGGCPVGTLCAPTTEAVCRANGGTIVARTAAECAATRGRCGGLAGMCNGSTICCAI